MPMIKINHLEPEGDVATGLMEQFHQLLEGVRRRAYELFEQRGGTHGADWEDWLRAEQELLFPAKFEVRQEPGSYNLCMSVPGFAAQDLKLYTLANGLILKCNAWQHLFGGEPRQRGAFYWWPLPAGAHAPGIAAELKHNRLEIKIPTVSKPKSVTVETTSKQIINQREGTAA